MKLILLSGGLDSAVLLYKEIAVQHCAALFIDYGQAAARKELNCAATLCALKGVMFTHQKMPSMDMEGDIINGRNLNLLARATSLAMSLGANQILIGATRDDGSFFPDCRREWFVSISKLTKVAYGIEVVAPFTEMTKQEVVALGASLGVPFEETWSCYYPTSHRKPCGECLACTTREEVLKP